MPSIVPYTAPGTMSGSQAAHVASRARKLLRAGRLTHHAYAVLDALLWLSRKPGTDAAAATYSRIQDLAHVARATVAKAIATLEQLGLLTRIKRKVLVLWNNGGRQWRQLPSAYRFHSEFTGQTEYQKEAILIIRPQQSAAQDRADHTALAERGRLIAQRLAAEDPAQRHERARQRWFRK